MWVKGGGIFYQVGVQGCIFFYNPPPKGGGKESKAPLGLGKKIKEEWKRREGKEKGKEKGKGKGKEKGRKRGKEGKRKENKSTNLLKKEEKNMRGKEMKKMDKRTNAKELRNFGNSLIIHDRRLSGVYILNI